MARPSKIGQLPAALRNELNQRLEDGHQAKNLVPWLNKRAQAFSSASASDDPESEPIEFTPITEQNLSDWRRGGFVEWQLLNGIYEASARLGEASDDFEDIDLDSKRFLILLKARFAGSLLAWDGSCQSAAYHSMNLLLRLIKGVLTMRRSEQLDERRELDLERLELTRATRARRPSSPKAPKTAATVPTPSDIAPARTPQIAQPPPLPAWVQRTAVVQTETRPPVPATVQPLPSEPETRPSATISSPSLVTPPAQSSNAVATAVAAVAAATPNQPAAPTAAQPTPARKPTVVQPPVNPNPYRLNLLH